ncbi:minor curlin subunit CsgB [Pseudoalteromonas tunicata]|jgi:minor curlin subunit|uniref:Minor curlin subunit CsgB, putative n=1 Tax=Pseudoalteromonas tunicata D2 TaxID=87626 RepID=A4C977_9GAMM|nr:minor curlin subunit CsgB [Pseudoalteromonas tunicata]ATC93647.1 minor curlin subunit [Pseudoalteromonas tunicata]AXT29478.1 curlin subunit CsgB [Pseudoalteromonas tunicata]EAR29142.1 minor curlin subunit CsgB, putative [Pseudoalteromonas tunicata D2]MDP4982492.1 curlin subunit CsgB [Pseudoalteromonas tunicata]MDP5211857.1 curlin subunit CsgB [Pseudoalteromonas tunicata]
MSLTLRPIRFSNNIKLKSLFSTVLLFCSAVAGANELFTQSNQDLQESPLSLSLNPTLQYRVGAQQHQVVITQYGILNKATVNQQNESTNEAYIVQNGSNNIAAILQYGSDNLINLSQQGNNNQAEVLQQGNANIANISQSGEQAFKVQQIGNDLVVNVTFSQQ